MLNLSFSGTVGAQKLPQYIWKSVNFIEFLSDKLY